MPEDKEGKLFLAVVVISGAMVLSEVIQLIRVMLVLSS